MYLSWMRQQLLSKALFAFGMSVAVPLWLRYFNKEWNDWKEYWPIITNRRKDRSGGHVDMDPTESHGFRKLLGKHCPERSFSGSRLYMKHLGFLLRYRLRFSKSGWGLRVYIANKLLNGAEAAVLWATFWIKRGSYSPTKCNSIISICIYFHNC